MIERHYKYLKMVKIEELPERYMEVAQVIGVENMVRLAEKFPGVPLYFKQPDKILFQAKRDYILDNFTGSNRRELALDTGLPLATVYKIIQDDLDAVNEVPTWKQETLI